MWDRIVYPFRECLISSHTLLEIVGWKYLPISWIRNFIAYLTGHSYDYLSLLGFTLNYVSVRSFEYTDGLSNLPFMTKNRLSYKANIVAADNLVRKKLIWAQLCRLHKAHQRTNGLEPIVRCSYKEGYNIILVYATCFGKNVSTEAWKDPAEPNTVTYDLLWLLLHVHNTDGTIRCLKWKQCPVKLKYWSFSCFLLKCLPWVLASYESIVSGSGLWHRVSTVVIVFVLNIILLWPHLGVQCTCANDIIIRSIFLKWEKNPYRLTYFERKAFLVSRLDEPASG